MASLSEQIASIKQQLGDQLCIMGHHYQHDSIIQHCDITGDSLELARRISHITAKHIVFCGVHFMGESAALLATPEQQVYLPAPDANCDMSLMSPAPQARRVLEQLHSLGRNVIPLAYVNTTLGLKAVVGEFGGAVCTSANARTMLQWALEQGDSVLFLPDRNLGRNTAVQLGLSSSDWYELNIAPQGLTAENSPENLQKRLLLWPGYCPIHEALSLKNVEKARQAYPNCRVVAHPECPPDLIAACDGAGSTSFLIQEADRCAQQGNTTLVIGTETNLVDRLAARYEGRCHIVPLAPAICPDMAKVTEENLLHCLQTILQATAKGLTIPAEQKPSAQQTLTRMLSVCS